MGMFCQKIARRNMTKTVNEMNGKLPYGAYVTN